MTSGFITLDQQCLALEKVLRTVLIETEAILNSKPLWYVSADFADHDPVAPNSLLMGRPDGSLPQVVHPKSPEQKKMETITGACWQILGSLYKNLLAWTANRGKVEKFLTRHQSQDGSDTGWPSVTSSLWKIGKVTKIFPGPDWQVRTTEVQINNRMYTRPFTA